MSFQERAESWRARAREGGVRLPILIGLTTLAVVVAVGAGSMLLQAASSDGVVVSSSGGRATAPSEADDGAGEEEGGSTVFVYVSGAVGAPGVFELPAGSRVCDAIDAAGGFAEGAAREELNLARVIADGEQLAVPAQVSLDAAEAEGGSAGQGGESRGTPSSKVNINRASAEELDALPGVGVSTAEKIIADREANGPFSSPEDLKRVSGIGDKKYAALADSITVG